MKVTKRAVHQVCTIGIALVWLLSGLLGKIFNLVPRHQQIVGRILGDEYAYIATKTIGALEVLMVVWILSGIKPRFCAITQILVVATMVSMESILTPDLLLFGRANLIPGAIFIGVVYFNEFFLSRADKSQPLQRI